MYCFWRLSPSSMTARKKKRLLRKMATGIILIKIQVVVLNKIDLMDVEERRAELEDTLKHHMKHTRFAMNAEF